MNVRSKRKRTNGSGPGEATDVAAAAPVGSGAGYDDLDAYIEKEMHRLRMPGVALAIVEGDKIVHLRGFGRAYADGAPPTPQTPFPVGSLNKSFTALAVMQLVEAGKMELDAPVQRYLPWFRVADPQASAQMTVRHLLNQTSGLPLSSGELIIADFDDSPGANERQARALARLALTRPVGAACEYSNTNYQLLGLIVEAVSGASYAAYIQQHILTPLDMWHTYTSPDVAKQNGQALGHRYWFGVPFAAPNLPIPGGALRDGLISASAEDMAHYLIAFLNGGRYGDAQVLSSAGIETLQRGAAPFGAAGLGPLVGFLTKDIDFGEYAMGWNVGEIDGTPFVWHGGTLPDFGAFMAHLPAQKKGIVLFFNACHHWMNPILADFGTRVTAVLAGKQPTPVPFVTLLRWMLPGQLLIPALQMAGVVATLRRLRRWQRAPAQRPGGSQAWNRHLLLPLIPNLLLGALTMRSLGSKRRNYLRLYMPDYVAIALVSGSFALLWSVVRSGLVIRALKANDDRRG